MSAFENGQEVKGSLVSTSAAFLLSLALALSAILLAPQDVAGSVVRLLDAALFDGVRYADGKSRINRPGYPIRMIEFDRRSMADFGASPQRPTVPHDKLSDILKVIQASREAKPALVFLDIAILDSAEFGDESQLALEATLDQWTKDPNAPLLGVLAGEVCNGPGVAKRLTTEIFPSVLVPMPEKVAPSSWKVIWACPTFDVVRMSEASWVCVNVNPPSGPPTRVALPSVGWLGEEVRREEKSVAQQSTAKSDAGRPSGLLDKLNAATRECRGKSAPGYRDLPLLKGGEAAFHSFQIGGGSLVTKVPATSVLSATFDPALLNASVVVIGRNHFFDDSALIADERVPGAYLAGVSIRDGIIHGTDLETSSWTDAAIASGVMALMYLMAAAAKWARRWIRSHCKAPLRLLLAIVTEEQIWFFVILYLGFVLTGFLSLRVAFPIGIGVLCGELSIFLRTRFLEWA